jgi:hypothetical protein
VAIVAKLVLNKVKKSKGSAPNNMRVNLLGEKKSREKTSSMEVAEITGKSSQRLGLKRTVPDSEMGTFHLPGVGMLNFKEFFCNEGDFRVFREFEGFFRNNENQKTEGYKRAITPDVIVLEG